MNVKIAVTVKGLGTKSEHVAGLSTYVGPLFFVSTHDEDFF